MDPSPKNSDSQKSIFQISRPGPVSRRLGIVSFAPANSGPIRTGSRLNTRTKRSTAIHRGLGSVLAWMIEGVGHDCKKGCHSVCSGWGLPEA